MKERKTYKVYTGVYRLIKMNIHNREAYFDTLTRVGLEVDKTLLKFLDEDKFGKAKRIMYEPFLKRKWGGQKLRAALTYLSYCAFTGENPEEPIDDDLLKLMTSTELELWSEYAANWIFDNKGEVRESPETRRKTAVAIKSFLEDAIRISDQVGKEYSDLILDTSGHVTESFTKELIMDMANNELLNGSLSKYMNLYRRDYAIPGIGRTLSLGGDLAALYSGENGSSRANKLHKIFLEWGIELEVLNDLGDFCMGTITTDKVATDQFSDIRNGAMTPPIWLMYNCANEKDKEFVLSCVGKTQLTQEEEFRLIKTLFETGTYDLVSKGLKRAGRDLKGLIKKLEFHNNGGSQLQQAATIFESNKIYPILRKNYLDVTGTKWNPRNKPQGSIGVEYKKYLEETKEI